MKETKPAFIIILPMVLFLSIVFSQVTGAAQKQERVPVLPPAKGELGDIPLPPAPAAVVPPGPVQGRAEPLPSADRQEAAARPTLEYSAEQLRDPFVEIITEDTGLAKMEGNKSQQEQKKSLPALTVQGLIWGGSLNQAIINNKVVKAGDTLEGARIVSIEKEGILVLFEGQQYSIPAPAAAGPLKKEGGPAPSPQNDAAGPAASLGSFTKEGKNEKTF